ncbi:MAG: SPFH domain-containing protein [Prevotellaceae bacterium]|jgi:regulator of protease activity HflC (stomatin/prohibitin superfamily)|nr:SPFH domain-containing protein [Prevotellaceae bacterium]
MESREFFRKVINGYFVIGFGFFVVGIAFVISFLTEVGNIPYFTYYLAFLAVIYALLLVGLKTINPNSAGVLTLFGKYRGSIKEDGLCWVNPLMTVKKISLRARSFNSDPIKVNDKMGNPIMIGIVLVWRVRDTFKAVFEVDNCVHFVEIQCDAAVRSLAGSYSYDNLEGESSEITLREGGEEVNQVLEKALVERLDIAGVEVIEARINYLAYAPEIAGAMLQRQQATAVVAARHKIVEGAVSMVEMALDQLANRRIVELDDERKAAMVSNLMVVLTSDKTATPVVNTGTLYN